jgi:lauroyl/myristoyl acyltransferase
VLRVAIAGAAAVGGRLRPETARSLATAGGTIEWAARPRKRRVLAENLGRVTGRAPGDPETGSLVRREILNEAYRSADFLWAVAFPGEVGPAVRTEGLERLESALVSGNGVILSSLHLGGWEVVAAAARGRLERQMAVIADEKWLALAVAGVRGREGLEVVNPGAAGQAVRVLRSGGIVVVLPDVPADGFRSFDVSLAGNTLRMPAGPASLARLAQAPVVPFAALPIAPRAWRVEFGEAIPPPARGDREDGEREVTQRLADAFTATLRDHAEHWAAVDPLPWVS